MDTDVVKKIELSAWFMVEMTLVELSKVVRDLELMDTRLWAFTKILPVPEKVHIEHWLTQDPRPSAAKLEAIISSVREDHLRETISSFGKAAQQMWTPFKDLDLEVEN